MDFHRETGGAFRLTLYRRERFDIAAFVEAWMAGDLHATALDIAYRSLAAAAANGSLPDCMACGEHLSAMPDCLCIMLAERPDPSNIMASGICPACALGSDAQITATIEGVLRRGMWPDLRVIDPAAVSPKAGRA